MEIGDTKCGKGKWCVLTPPPPPSLCHIVCICNIIALRNVLATYYGPVLWAWSKTLDQIDWNQAQTAMHRVW